MQNTNVTLTMPRDWSELLQRIANEETDGNKSAVIREMLLLKFDQHGYAACCECSELGKIDRMRIDESGYMYICADCANASGV